ncbi:hypothetical protein LX69_01861 [Breznakibacter xylanolyticus]|uniref:Uncharacterized protein n=1 Tax=Breznakibacter xylanolyticus TaxID=990 RepID=A0A2W7NE36_9BACT|nr:hypothetical protein [Breznakibacter xylanolyticus]MBN2744078.1 hypothetical protein [Marinilabiliaceae bacterium]PZX16367.1 hypothetical protein LX69_01861 [Breznakibacter xylanolyticus]
MRQYKNPLAQKIHEIMLPLVGEFMAGGVLKTQSKNIGISEDDIKPEHIPSLAEAIKKGLTLFLGSDVANKVCDQIKMIK